MTISQKQMKARSRNWKIFRLRGMWQTARNLGLPNEKALLFDIEMAIMSLGGTPEWKLRENLQQELDALSSPRSA